MSNTEDIDLLSNNSVHRFDGYSIFMRKDGITQLQFTAGFNGDHEDAKIMVQTFSVLNPNQKCLLLVVYQEDNTFSKEAREYIASEEVSKVIKADSFVIKGLAIRIIANGYLKINKPIRPPRLFNTQQDAVNWLSQFKEEI